MGAAAAALCAAAAPGLEKVVFVGGHPDDFAAQIGLALLMRGKFEVHVVDFTHGERGCGPEKFKSGWTKAKRTKEEEVSARRSARRSTGLTRWTARRTPAVRRARSSRRY